jgi:hypothetical protein
MVIHDIQLTGVRLKRTGEEPLKPARRPGKRRPYKRTYQSGAQEANGDNAGGDDDGRDDDGQEILNDVHVGPKIKRRIRFRVSCPCPQTPKPPV